MLELQSLGRVAQSERRQLTVMFCDLVGSTALFTNLDPEEVSEILRSHLQRSADRIEAAGGFVAQFQGRPGRPRNHRCDAER
jgi:class 3 adenylate cyclase